MSTNSPLFKEFKKVLFLAKSISIFDLSRRLGVSEDGLIESLTEWQEIIPFEKKGSQLALLICQIIKMCYWSKRNLTS